MSSPQEVWNLLVNPARLPEWIRGAKKIVAANGYPAKDGRLSFRVGPFRVVERVIDSKAPEVLRVQVDSPLAAVVVTHRIAAQGAGSHYEKSVEVEWKGFWRSVLGRVVLGRNIPREIARLASAASNGRPSDEKG